MTAVASFLQQFFGMMGLPTWSGPAAVVLGLLLGMPWILKNRRTDRARRHLKLALRTYGAERDRLESEALAEVAGQPMGLLVLAEEADRAGRFALRDRAVAALRATGKLPYEVRRMEANIEGPMPATAAEAVVNVVMLRREGLTPLADARLARFREKWPRDEELASLQQTGAESVGSSAT